MTSMTKSLVHRAIALMLAAHSLHVLAQSPSGDVGEVKAWLVTATEAKDFQGEAGFNEQPALRPRSVSPAIDILRPEPVADLKVKSPFAIAVQFKPQSDAEIDPATFKVLYGALKLDITNRIARYVKIGKEGFTLENAQIPTGRHRLTVQIQDVKQRLAERELRLEVE
jgi:hypothetical protein